MALAPLQAEPLVSVLMPSYNYASYVTAAIASVQAQSWTHLEIIVCDDGSTDGSADIVRRLAASDDRIRLIVQENAGVAVALNRAFAAARGEVICLLDADDVYEATKIAAVVATMQRKQQAGFVQHAMSVVDAAGEFIRTLPTHGHFEAGWLGPALLKRGGRWRNMPASALSFRREVAERLFPLPAAYLSSMADAYLYMLAPLLTEVAYQPEPLSSYRLHGNNLTGALHFDAQLSRKYVEGIARVHAAVKDAVDRRGLSLPAYAAADHLTHNEHQFMVQLFSGAARGALWSMYRVLVRQIRADDLYPEKRKLAGIAVLGVAILLPLQSRAGWVSRMMG
ncbi:MAG: glycosyltransferase [Bacteroidota bacterium]